MTSEIKTLIRKAFIILTSEKLDEEIIYEKWAEYKGNDDIFYLISIENNQLILHTHEGYSDGYEFIPLKKFNFETLDKAHESLTVLVNILQEFINGKRGSKATWYTDYPAEYLREYDEMEIEEYWK